MSKILLERILIDVANDIKVVITRFNQTPFVALTKDVINSFCPNANSAAYMIVEFIHKFINISVGCCEHEVIMILHENKCVNLYWMSLLRSFYSIKAYLPHLWHGKSEPFTVIGPSGDVVGMKL